MKPSVKGFFDTDTNTISYVVVAPESRATAIIDSVLGDIEVRSNHGYLIVGVRDADGVTTLNPPADLRLRLGDVVIVLGHLDDIPHLAARFSSQRAKLTYRGVTQEG